MGRQDQIIQERLRKLSELKKLGINPYPNKFEKKNSTEELQKKYKSLKNNNHKKDRVTIAGRLMTSRDLGKIAFGTLQDSSGKIQIVLQEGETPNKLRDLYKKYIDAGDFIGLEGSVFRTQRGELSVLVKSLTLLTKSLLPLPEKWHGLQDKEERYRKRYTDLIINPNIKEVFSKRQIIIDSIREFMIKKDYVEVQTPILQPIYGGGSARPFTSNLNALDMKVYMRIANELYLKRLVVGGMEKVFEFSIDFRNEGIDRSHNPEFLLFEAMTAYDDYKDGMDIIENITEYAVKKATKGTKITYQGRKIDFKKPWRRITVRDAIKRYADIDIEKTDDKELKNILKKNKLELKGDYTRGNAIMALIEEFCEKEFIQPTILYDYPRETSPLAKLHRKNPAYVERFEQFVNGIELGNNYTELNDPQVLRENWEAEEKALKKGDEDAQRMDEDFINALEVGMPPTCGIAIGIDRLVMFLTDQPSIRDVILFPFMRPKDHKTKKEVKNGRNNNKK